MSAILSMRGIRSGYDHADVLADVNIDIEDGAVTCLLGANGAGKSTLVRAIMGLTPASAGTITFAGEDISGWATHRIVGAGIACIPEGRRMFPKLTVEENLRLGAYAKGGRLSRGLDRVYSLFPRLAERRAQMAGTLSGGEQAMVSIGRGVVAEPRLLVIDEPSLGLSPLFVKESFAIIHKLNADGTTVFLIEQNVRQTLAISHAGYVLSQGRVTASGTSTQLAADEDVKRAYFG
ncbi:ABC transporter ATP-binding protein [Xanthobacter flavus]|uniref:ABC transporter ATP-binding protein n=1 Tax=Xanthobacter flavus TaxID=281 RepID=UPI001AE47B57|nr:ABC transporter ATP-binding protein [Xanthobacter flavus]MBP2150858.1 branched-chain amino acid transport system ATP-binding protein [Xanthobacter flavus]